MNLLALAQDALGGGKKVFLQADRTKTGLFVTDLPARFPENVREAEERLGKAGFQISHKNSGSLWILTPSAVLMEKSLRCAEKEDIFPLPEPYFALGQLALHFTYFDEDSLSCAWHILWETFIPQAQPERLYTALCQESAKALRLGQPCPGKGCAGLIMRYAMHKSEKENKTHV